MGKPKIRFKGYEDDWEQRKLSDIYASIGNAFVGTATPYYVESGHFYLESNNIKDGQINHNSEIFINDEFYEKQKDKWLHTGDMVMVQSGHVGHAAVIPEELDNSAAHALIMFRHPKEKIEPYFLNYQYQTNKSKKKIEEITTGNTIKHILASDMQEFVVDITNYDEQKKIGSYFQKLDHLITLHQRKCYRFIDIALDAWEQRKLKDYLEVSREKNKTESYGKEDVLSVSGEHGIVNQIEFQGRSFAGVSVANYGVVEAGDVVYTKSPLKSNPYGIIKTNKGKTGIVSTLYAVYKPRMNTNSEFVQIYFELDSRMNSYMHPLVNKGAKNDMKVSDENALKGPVAFPELEEQNAITQYFDKLDRLITLHQRKCEETKSLKKYMLQKMFPENGNCVPKIRFSGFADAWEQRKWIDVVDISTEMVNPTTGEYDNMPHIAPGNIESFTGRILDNVKTVKEEQLISGKFRFRPDDVVYGKINPQLGKYFYATVNGLTSADAYVFNGKNGLKQKFLFALLQTSDFFKYSVSVSKRSGMPKINRDELNAYSFLMPSEEEQDRIGSYLLQLDHLITLHQHKCDELQKLKKFMLQNMFV